MTPKQINDFMTWVTSDFLESADRGMTRTMHGSPVTWSQLIVAIAVNIWMMPFLVVFALIGRRK
jgi:hypothetical protein